MKPDFSTLKPVSNQPDFSTLKPITTSQPQSGSIANDIWTGLVGNVKEASNSLTASAEGKMNPFAAGANIAKNVTEGVLQPLNQTVGKAIGKVVNPVVDAIANKVSDSKAVQDFASLMDKHPVLGNAISDIVQTGLNTAQIGLGTEGVQKTPEIANKVSSKVSDSIMGTPADQASAQLAKEHADIATKAQAQLKGAISDATPTYSDKLISQPPVKLEDGSFLPRVQEGGGLKGRSVTTSPLETQAGQALTKVPDYPTNGTALEKYNAVKPEIARQGQALETSLEKENILRPPKEVANVVRNAVNNVPKESLLLQKSDPVIKNYMRVVQNAIEQNPGTLKGELLVKKTLDDAYNNARGKMAFGSDKISALDDVHTAGRDALTQDIIAHAKSTDVKASLKSQWDLYRASDVLLKKAEEEGNTKIEQLMKKHPTATKVVNLGAKAVGADALIRLVK